MKPATQDTIWKESYIMNKRVQAFLAKMQEKELDGIIINNLKNVYYLTGFWGFICPKMAKMDKF